MYCNSSHSEFLWLISFINKAIENKITIFNCSVSNEILFQIQKTLQPHSSIGQTTLSLSVNGIYVTDHPGVNVKTYGSKGANRKDEWQEEVFWQESEKSPQPPTIHKPACEKAFCTCSEVNCQINSPQVLKLPPKFSQCLHKTSTTKEQWEFVYLVDEL